jgi:tRNA A37 threonylcarbamoyladenosine dehydratase
MDDAVHQHETAFRTKAVMTKMSSTKVVICGAGALGANIAEGMARCGFEAIKMIDFDRVDPSNLCTQPYSRVDCGSKKVMAIGNIIEDAVGVVIECVDKRLDENNVDKLLRGSDIVVDAFDNALSRRIVYDYCLAKKMHCIHSGMGDGYSEAVWNESYIVPKGDSGVDPCHVPLARNLAVITSAITIELIIAFIQHGVKTSKSFTLLDLKIS